MRKWVVKTPDGAVLKIVGKIFWGLICCYLSVACVSCTGQCGPWAGCGLGVRSAGRGWTDAWADAQCTGAGGSPWPEPSRWSSGTFWPISSTWDGAADCVGSGKGPSWGACRKAAADSRPSPGPWCPDSTNRCDCRKSPQSCARRQSPRGPSSTACRWTCCGDRSSCPAGHSHRNQLSTGHIFILENATTNIK